MANAPSPPRVGRAGVPLVRLEADRTASGTERATADVRVAIGGRPVHLQITVPTGPAHIRDLLPIFQGLADVVVDVGEQQVVRAGQAISCRKGCGACCRQLVPISPSEARALARVVAVLPEPRQSAVRGRFATALERLRDAGVLQPLLDRGREESTPLRPLGLAYFRQGVPCPFLEDESCSIHPDRPLACREYLVTSPAAECARPTPETVRCVPLPARTSAALRRVERDAAPDEAEWVPLVLALEYAAAHPDEPAPRPGQLLLADFFASLTGEPATAGT
jgi:Fe-S-cluster containining protein